MLTLGGPAIRYRFATKTADYILCARCGVYVAAVAEIGGQLYATLNLNAFDDRRPGLAAEPVAYDGESVEAKAERRRAAWTPLRLA
ncbi:MAG TPA: hypothetical protein VLK25_11295 [Allosphingosinicella sp.]|nr:hypothetical protein [Allosphingosinicella sp.]